MFLTVTLVPEATVDDAWKLKSLITMVAAVAWFEVPDGVCVPGGCELYVAPLDEHPANSRATAEAAKVLLVLSFMAFISKKIICSDSGPAFTWYLIKDSRRLLI
jgi:hypothetical protein